MTNDMFIVHVPLHTGIDCFAAPGNFNYNLGQVRYLFNQYIN